jgi:hypothetical protein
MTWTELKSSNAASRVMLAAVNQSGRHHRAVRAPPIAKILAAHADGQNSEELKILEVQNVATGALGNLQRRAKHIPAAINCGSQRLAPNLSAAWVAVRVVNDRFGGGGRWDLALACASLSLVMLVLTGVL